MATTEKEAMETKKEYWIGFDLGGTKMLAVVFDSQFKQVGKARKKTKGHEGMAAGLVRINGVIRDAMEDAKVRPEQVGGLGIGCPGPLDLKAGVIQEAPNLGWKNVPVRKSIQKEFGFPVEVSNDVDAGVFGEYSFGAGRGARCVVGIFPGTGIGGGCVYNGHLLQGANCTCMEIGHIPIMANGVLDGAGNLGSLESLASRLAIASSAAQAAYRGQAPTLMEKHGTDLSNIRSGALAASVAGGDKMVESIVKNAAEKIGWGIVTIVHLLAPDVIVMGGGLVEAMPELITKTAEETARNRVLPSLKDVFKVVPAELGDNAGVLGAAALAYQMVTGKGFTPSS